MIRPELLLDGRNVRFAWTAESGRAFYPRREDVTASVTDGGPWRDVDLTGTATYDRLPAVGRAISLDGDESSYANVTDIPAPPVSAVTLGLLFRIRQWQEDWQGVFVWRDATASDSLLVLVRHAGGNQYRVTVDQQQSFNSTPPFTATIVGEWTCLILTWDSVTREIKWYVNGKLEDAQTDPSSVSSIRSNAGDNILLGASKGAVDVGPSDYAYAYVLDRALSEEEAIRRSSLSSAWEWLGHPRQQTTYTARPERTTSRVPKRVTSAVRPPPLVTDVDWGHPLMRGCVSVISTLAGRVVRYVPGQRPLTYSRADTTPGSKFGRPIALFHPTDSADIPLGTIGPDDPLSLVGATDVTVWFAGVLGSGLPWSRVFEKNSSSNSNGWYVRIGNGAFASAYNEYVLSIAGTQIIFQAATDNVDARTFGISASGIGGATTSNLYVNGKFDSTESGTMPAFPNNTLTATLGGRDSGNRALRDGAVGLFVVWDRVLDASEHRLLDQNPYAFLRGPSRSLHFGSAPDSTIPMAFLRLQKRGANPPTYVSGINWSSPLADGLSWCWSPFARWDRTHDTPHASSLQLDNMGGFRGSGGVYGADVSRTTGLYVRHTDGSSKIVDLRDVWDIDGRGGSYVFRGYLDSLPSPGTAYPGFWRTRSDARGASFLVLDKDNNYRLYSDVSDVEMRDNSGTWGGIQNGFSGSIVVAYGQSSQSFYVDGETVFSPSASLSQPTAADSSEIFVMGWQWQTFEKVGGIWQDVRFYAKRLTDEHQRAIHTHPYDIYQTHARTYFLGSSTTSTAPATIRVQKKLKTRGVKVNWSDPKLRNCVAIITTFDGRPERHYPSGRVERLTVDNSSSSISQTPAHIGSGRYSSEFVGNTSDDRIQLGSITSADPISFFGQTDISIVARCNYALSGSEYPRVIDKSDGVIGTNGWSWFIREGPPPAFEFGINGDSNSTGGEYNPNLTTFPVRSLGLNVTNVPLSGTATVGIRGFANGKFSGFRAEPLGPFPSTTTDASVGNWNHTSNRQWNGNIEYVALFDKPLSDAEHLAFDRDGYSFFDLRQVSYPIDGTAPSTASRGVSLRKVRTW